MEQNRLQIAAVSYLNTIPFIYGLRNYEPAIGIFDLNLMPPAACADAFRNGEADIALVPVGAMTTDDLDNLCCNWCLGADEPVETVLLLSEKPIKELPVIYLDTESRTSVLLIRILAKHHWKISPEFLPLSDLKGNDPGEGEGVLLIGDKTFNLGNRYRFRTDLAEEWQKMTGLPAVFACWLTKPAVADSYKQLFDNALSWGVQNIDNAILDLGKELLPFDKAKRYLTRCISYKLDEMKREALRRFFEYRLEI